MQQLLDFLQSYLRAQPQPSGMVRRGVAPPSMQPQQQQPAPTMATAYAPPPTLATAKSYGGDINQQFNQALGFAPAQPAAPKGPMAKLMGAYDNSLGYSNPGMPRRGV